MTDTTFTEFYALVAHAIRSGMPRDFAVEEMVVNIPEGEKDKCRIALRRVWDAIEESIGD